MCYIFDHMLTHRRTTPKTHTKRRFFALLVVALVIIGSTFYVQSAQEPVETPAHEQEIVDKTQQTNPEKIARAAEALGKLAMQERASRDGYSRAEFGDGWASKDGCDMRNRILQRDLTEVTLDDDGCTVLKGFLQNDPYTSQDIHFQRGRATSSAVQIEHIVALSDAWQKGAQQLAPEKRITFANDPLNLIAVDGPANMQKGDKDASDWLPHENYHCRYVARQIAIKDKYDLWVTEQEHAAIERTLQTCPTQILPIEREHTTP